MIKRTITESEYASIVKKIHMTFIIFPILFGISFVWLGVYVSKSLIVTWLSFFMSLIIVTPTIKQIVHYKKYLNAMIESKEVRRILSDLYDIIDD